MDGMFCMNGTTSVPKSVLRYTVDKVRNKGRRVTLKYFSILIKVSRKVCCAMIYADKAHVNS